MAVPVTTQLFDAFLGAQEGIHSIALPDVFSSGGSNNLYIDKFGRARKILGYTLQNQGGMSGLIGNGTVVALIPYRSTSAGTTTRQLIAGVWDDGSSTSLLYYMSDDDGATWTFIGGSLPTAPDGFLPDGAQFGSDLFLTGGGYTPSVWDGTTFANAGRSQSPTITASASTNAGLLNGTYKYKLVAISTSGVRAAGSVASAVVSLTDKQMSLTWTALTDVTVAGYEIYRTSGTGTVFYFLDYVNDKTSAAYTDNIGDLTILENRVMAEHGDAPPDAYFCEPHKQRMWWGRTDDFPTRAYWSDPGLAADVWGNNYLDFSDSETVGDKIVGMIGNMEGKLVVLTEKAIWTVSGTGQVIGNIVDWTRIKTNAQIGATHHRAAVKVPAGAVYTDQNGQKQITNVVTLAYLTPVNDIRVFDGDNDVIISNPIKTTLSVMNYAQRHRAFCVTDNPRREITWVFPEDAAGDPTTAVVWNYQWGVWYTRDWAFSHAVEVETSSDASLLLAGGNEAVATAKVYQLWNGSSFAGGNIPAYWMTKTLYGVNDQGQPAVANTKRWRWIDLLFQTEQSTSLSIEWFTGTANDDGSAEASRFVSPAAAYIFTSNSDRILTNDGDAITVGQKTTLVQIPLTSSTTGDYLHDTGIRLRIGDDSTNGQWAVEGFTLAYQILPGLQRRMFA